MIIIFDLSLFVKMSLNGYSEYYINYGGNYVDAYPDNWHVHSYYEYIERLYPKPTPNGFLPYCEMDIYNKFNHELKKIPVSCIIQDFMKLHNVTELDLSNITVQWDGHQFPDRLYLQLINLKKLNVSNWNITNSKQMPTFDCPALTEIIGLNTWNVSDMTDFSCMFQDCHSLVSLDLSNWDTSKAENMGSMFRDCSSLVEIIGIETCPNIKYAHYMFAGCVQLKCVDIHNWDARNICCNYMFQGCKSLIDIIGIERIQIRDPKLEEHMFDGCDSLTPLTNPTLELVKSYFHSQAIDQLKQEVQLLKRQRTAEVEQLRNDMNAKTEDIEQLKNDMNAKTEDIEQLRNDMNAKTEDIEQLKNTITEQQKQIDQLKEALLKFVSSL